MDTVLENKFGPVYADEEMPTDKPASFREIPRRLKSDPKIDYSVLDNVSAAFTSSRFGILLSDFFSEEQKDNLDPQNITGVGGKSFDKWEAFNNAGYKPDQAAYYDINVESYSDFRIFDKKYKKISQAKQVMAESGFTGGVANFLAETIGDPVFLATIPFAAPAKIPKVASFAIVGAASTIPSEAIALAVDPTRTTQDAVVNVAASTVFAGVLGGAVDTFTALGRKGATKMGPDLNVASNKIIKEINAPKDVDPLEIIFNAQSTVGAQKTPTIDYSPGGSAAGRLAAKIFAPLSPSNRSANYIAPESQALNAKIAGNPLYVTKAAEEGVALGETVPDFVQKYTARFTHVSDQTNNLITHTSKTTKINKNELNEMYYRLVQDKTISIDDLLAKAESDDPLSNIYKAAYNQRVHSSSIADDFESVGIGGFNRRRNYGHQVRFNRMKASADEFGLREKIIKDYSKLRDRMVAQFGKDINNIKKFKENLLLKRSEFEDQLDVDGRTYEEVLAKLEDEVDEIKRVIIATEEDFAVWADADLTDILHGKSESLAYLGFGKAREKPGFFLPRNIDPLEYQPWLETDYQKLNASYGRTAAAKIGFKKILGDQTGEAAIKEYEGLMNEKITQARTAKNQKLAERLAKERNAVVSDAVGLLRQHEGTYASEFYAANPTIASLLEGASNMISMSALGNSVLGSMAEMAAIQLHHGITKVAPGYSKALTKMATDPDFRKMAKADLQATGRAFELAHNALVGDIVLEGGNLGDASIRGFATMETAKKYYYRMTGQVYYDYFVRNVNALVQQDVLIKNVKKLASGKLKDRDMEQLAGLGIGKEEAKRILPFIEKHVTYDSKLPFLNIGNWEDKQLAEIVKTALIRDQRRTSLYMRTGDLPIISAHPAMRLLLKFKQWPLLATQNYMIPSIQRADATALSGAMVMAGFGSLTYMARELASGRDIPEDPVDILYAGIEMSGVGGITHEFGLNYLANYAGIQGGGAKYVGYGSLLEKMVGPASTFVRNIDNFSREVSEAARGEDDFELKDMKYLWKLMPLNNHPFAKAIETNLEE